MSIQPPPRRARDGADPVPPLFAMASSDPDQQLVARGELGEEEVAQIDAVMAALARLRAAERELSEAALRYMELGETDMRALHFLIVCENTDTLATPGAIAQSLGISTASTTKLLDRLAASGHVRREPHPSDRRALVVTIEPGTRATAVRTMGAQQARRVHAARRLDAAEREVVVRFLTDMAEEISVDGLDWGSAPSR